MIDISNKKSGELTPFQQELVDALKQVSEYKTICEANVVAAIYKQPDLIYDSNLKLELFHNNVWRVYFNIADQILNNEKKVILDDMTVGLYLEKHPKLREKYEEYGGYNTIEQAMEYINTSTFTGYVNELLKWNTVRELGILKFPIKDKLSDYADMTIDEIYEELEVMLNHTFINTNQDVKSYQISDGIYDLIEQLDKGVAKGLPYADLPLLTNETGGQYLGSITLVGGLSNVGKSTFARNTVIPSIIKNNEKVVIMINEDSRAKYQRELLVWVANAIYKEDLQKYILRDGGFEDKTKQLLYKCAKWIEEKTADNTITIIPFEKYYTEKAIKVIKKYAALGVKYFVLDTFKMDSGKVSDKSWLQLQQAMVDINDVIKPEVKNLHILITFQLAKGSAIQRYYTQDNIGLAKNIVDPASTCIMIRNLFDDEREGQKRELKVYSLEGKNGKTRIPVHLKDDRHYQILFIVKNREGSANQFQIVVEHDMSRNILKEVGITNIMPDTF